MVYKILFIFVIFISFLNAKINLKNLQSFHSGFIQDINSSSGKKISYKGEVFIKNNGKVLWKYKTPIVKNVYVLKNYAIIDEPELEQAIFTHLKDEINIINILKTAVKLKENLYKTKINNMDYFIHLKNDIIDKISYKDELENNISIKFINTIINKKIDEQVFKFEAPDYYDIIRK